MMEYRSLSVAMCSYARSGLSDMLVAEAALSSYRAGMVLSVKKVVPVSKVARELAAVVARQTVKQVRVLKLAAVPEYMLLLQRRIVPDKSAVEP